MYGPERTAKLRDEQKQATKDKKAALVARMRAKQQQTAINNQKMETPTQPTADEIINLRRRVHRLEQDNKKLRTQQQERVTTLQQELNKAKKRAGTMRAEVQKQTKISTAAQQKLATIQHQTEEFKTRMLRAETSLFKATADNERKDAVVRTHIKRARILTKQNNSLQTRVAQLEGRVVTYADAMTLQGELPNYKKWRQAERYYLRVEAHVRELQGEIALLKAKQHTLLAEERKQIAELELALKQQLTTLTNVGTKRILRVLTDRVAAGLSAEEMRAGVLFADKFEKYMLKVLAKQNLAAPETVRYNAAFAPTDMGKLRLKGRELLGVIVELPPAGIAKRTLDVPASVPGFKLVRSLDGIPIGFRTLEGVIETTVYIRNGFSLQIGDVVRAEVTTDDEPETAFVNHWYRLRGLQDVGAEAKTPAPVRQTPKSDTGFKIPNFIENPAVLQGKRVLIVSGQKEHRGISKILAHLGTEVVIIKEAKREIGQLRSALNGHQYDLILADKSHTSHSAVEAVKLARVDWARVLGRGPSVTQTVGLIYNYFMAQASQAEH